MGPILTAIVPTCSSPSEDSIAAPGRHGATRCMSSMTSHARSTGAGTVNSFSSLNARLRSERLEELPLAGTEQLRDRLFLHQPREVLGVHVGVVARLVRVLLVEVEELRVLAGAVRLVVEV